MAAKKTTEPAPDVIRYRDGEGRTHWASRTAPKVVKGLADGSITIAGEAAADAPKVPKPSDAPNPGPAAA